jgi:hypothetical protein|tara:strand:- start:1445 stop:1915 length:471 start_codon:yes stop_codon:yes gene_type:complete
MVIGLGGLMLTPNDLSGCYPVRNEIPWGYDSRRGPIDGDGRIAILFIPKKFRRIERLVHKILGGSNHLRRPMDALMTVVWELCDGTNSFEQLCNQLDDIFKEEIAPVDERTCAAIDNLGRSGLIEIHRQLPLIEHNIHPHPLPDQHFDWLYTQEEE